VSLPVSPTIHKDRRTGLLDNQHIERVLIQEREALQGLKREYDQRWQALLRAEAIFLREGEGKKLIRSRITRELYLKVRS